MQSTSLLPKVRYASREGVSVKEVQSYSGRRDGSTMFELRVVDVGVVCPRSDLPDYSADNSLPSRGTSSSLAVATSSGILVIIYYFKYV